MSLENNYKQLIIKKNKNYLLQNSRKIVKISVINKKANTYIK